VTVLASSLGRVSDLCFSGPPDDLGVPAILPLPSWARFLSLATTRVATGDGDSIIAVFSVPTRDWAASIMLASAVVDDDALAPSSSRDLAAHLATLEDLESGAPVRVFEPQKDGTLKVRDATWRGIGPSKFPKFATDDRIRFEISGQDYRELRLEVAQRVHPAEHQRDGGRRPYSLAIPPLVRGIIGDESSLGYVTADRYAAVAVGTVAVLAEELEAPMFCPCGLPGSHGTLQDLARCDKLSCAGRGRRSAIFASRSRPRPAQEELDPRIVIYDGGGAFFGWGTRWPKARKIIVVDRSSAVAQDVALELNSAAAYGDRDNDILDGLDIPDGIEAMVFRGDL
jgi:hypothetical protein